MVGGPGLENRVAAIFEKSAPAISCTKYTGNNYCRPCFESNAWFQTDLSAFAPESDADAAVERMDEVMPPSPHRIYIHIEPTKKEPISWKLRL